jgi:hypothetical protein
VNWCCEHGSLCLEIGDRLPSVIFSARGARGSTLRLYRCRSLPSRVAAPGSPLNVCCLLPDGCLVCCPAAGFPLSSVSSPFKFAICNPQSPNPCRPEKPVRGDQHSDHAPCVPGGLLIYLTHNLRSPREGGAGSGSVPTRIPDPPGPRPPFSFARSFLARVEWLWARAIPISKVEFRICQPRFPVSPVLLVSVSPCLQFSVPPIFRCASAPMHLCSSAALRRFTDSPILRFAVSPVLLVPVSSILSPRSQWRVP